MRRLALAPAFVLIACLPGHAAAQPQPTGRFQVTATAGSPPTVVMHDTTTGQSWVLVQTPGATRAMGTAALLDARQQADGAATNAHGGGCAAGRAVREARQGKKISPDHILLFFSVRRLWGQRCA